MATKICVNIRDYRHPIVLRQTEEKNFTLQYGEQHITHLQADNAATLLGRAILHAASLKGLIDGEVSGVIA